jgi:hypothetical protein
MPQQLSNLLRNHQYELGNTTKKKQSLMSHLCGFFCLGFKHILNVSKFRTKNIVNDA